MYIDLLVTFPLTIFIARTKPHEKLTADLPTESLFYVPILMSVIVMAFIQFAFQTFFFFNIQNRPFYKPPVNLGGDTLTTDDWVSFEDTVLFYVGNFQYLAACISFSVSKPYRLPIWSNYWLFFSIIGAYILAVLFLWIPAGSPFMFAVFKDLEWCTKAYPDINDSGPVSNDCYTKYNWFILFVCSINTIITYAFEAFFIRKFTIRYDDRKENQKTEKFSQEM